MYIDLYFSTEHYPFLSSLSYRSLSRAAVCNRPDICKALSQRGAVLSFRDTNGMTPLHYAIQKGKCRGTFAIPPITVHVCE